MDGVHKVPSRWQFAWAWCNAHNPRLITLLRATQARRASGTVGADWLLKVSDPKLKHHVVFGVIRQVPEIGFQGPDVPADARDFPLRDIKSLEVTGAGDHAVLVVHLHTGPSCSLAFRRTLAGQLQQFVDVVTPDLDKSDRILKSLDSERQLLLDSSFALERYRTDAIAAARRRLDEVRMLRHDRRLIDAP